MYSQIYSFSCVLIVCACVVSAYPTSERREHINELVSLLGRLKNIEWSRHQQQQQQHHYYLHHEQHDLLPGLSLSPSSHSSTLRSSSSLSPNAMEALKTLGTKVRGAAARTDDFTDPIFTGRGNNDVLGLDINNDSKSRSAEDSGSEKTKRQGAWSYDYGLGGGRFGKRNYGDYGIGGGRFGRDVDHVDVSDTSDADAASL